MDVVKGLSDEKNINNGMIPCSISPLMFKMQRNVGAILISIQSFNLVARKKQETFIKPN